MSTLRLAILFSASLLLCNAAAAETKKSPPKSSRSWKAVVDHAWKNGTDWPIKSPSSKTLGFSESEVKAKGVSIEDDKSSDGREHAFKVVYDLDAKGAPRPKEVTISTTKVAESPNGKQVDGYIARVSLDGKLIRGMRSLGIVGQVKQTPLDAGSGELKAFFEKEKAFYLKEIDLAKLIP